jgi:hypothetical protein
MAKRAARRSVPVKTRTARRYRKVTYSLPEQVAREIDARHAGSEQGKSRLVAEALAFYFADQDRRALAAVYSEAAQDPQFQADNEAIQRDFAALDREADRAIR